MPDCRRDEARVLPRLPREVGHSANQSPVGDDLRKIDRPFRQKSAFDARPISVRWDDRDLPPLAPVRDHSRSKVTARCGETRGRDLCFERLPWGVPISGPPRRRGRALHGRPRGPISGARCPAGAAEARQDRPAGALRQDAHSWSHRHLQGAATGDREGVDARELRDFAPTISHLLRQTSARRKRLARAKFVAQDGGARVALGEFLAPAVEVDGVEASRPDLWRPPCKTTRFP
jgi:hypothetical protein